MYADEPWRETSVGLLGSNEPNIDEVVTALREWADEETNADSQSREAAKARGTYKAPTPQRPATPEKENAMTTFIPGDYAVTYYEAQAAWARVGRAREVSVPTEDLYDAARALHTRLVSLNAWVERLLWECDGSPSRLFDSMSREDLRCYMEAKRPLTSDSRASNEFVLAVRAFIDDCGWLPRGFEDHIGCYSESLVTYNKDDGETRFV